MIANKTITVLLTLVNRLLLFIVADCLESLLELRKIFADESDDILSCHLFLLIL